ncbi:TPA: LPXTG cell wall anchor domain-containing protein [Enterococcus faecium]|uniref:LPXTG cell wall anchor domain-containing protein n=1 Tax=Enterococcus faecium TaxID=1352 RepID=UPI000665E384|nr:LPXTG cell wall anchor domain-containing protein [Enterococcus faecium]EGP4820714.1 LPXTG cell wall anchor domain-containing protein [Enterococcus faecium]
MRYSTILISTFAALSLSLTINQTVHTEEIETAKWTETKWANVNRITFQDEFSSFNSGVAKLRKGQTATIKAKIDYSGDLAPILQSAVTFENVDPALSIGYDENTLTIQHKQAIFTFTVTLNLDLLKPALFTVKVSDGLPNDHHHLTPYSQRQTIEQDSAIDSGGDLVEEPTDKPENENKPEVPPTENPDGEQKPEIEPGEEPDVDPEEKPDVTPEPDTDARDQGIPEKINKKTIQEDGKKESKKSNLAILKINEEQLNKKSRIFDSAQSAETLKSSKDTTFASPETKNKQLPKSGESQNKVILWSGIILLSIATMLSAKRFKKNRSL